MTRKSPRSRVVWVAVGDTIPSSQPRGLMPVGSSSNRVNTNQKLSTTPLSFAREPRARSSGARAGRGPRDLLPPGARVARPVARVITRSSRTPDGKTLPRVRSEKTLGASLPRPLRTDRETTGRQERETSPPSPPGQPEHHRRSTPTCRCMRGRIARSRTSLSIPCTERG